MLKPERRFQDEDEFLDGVHVALVTNNKDPENQGRVKVRFPWLDDTAESHWCRLSARYAGKDRGMYFVPEVGDEVLVVFELIIDHSECRKGTVRQRPQLVHRPHR